MNQTMVLAPLFALAALGCDETFVLPPQTPAVPPQGAGVEAWPEPERFLAVEYGGVVERVATMIFDPEIRSAAERRGLDLVNVAWEDTGRAHGSALGPNISDLTLQVRPRDPSGRFADALMPVIRHANFTDRTGDVPADRFFLRVGNERGGALRTVPLAEVLKDLRRFATSPGTLAGDAGAGAPLDLSAPRDTHYLVSAQAVFLPIPRAGKAEFNPVVFNYQSAPESPAVLAIVASREGTSMTVIENRTDDLTVQGWGQELYFNDGGQRAAFTAERRSDVAARIAAQGGPKSEADRSALGKGADVIALIQVPLVHANMGVLGGLVPKGSSSEGYGYEFSDDPLAGGGFGPSDATIRVRPGPVRTQLERAVVGHGPHLGPFTEGHGARLVRDARFPVRITVQFYKATSTGEVSEADMDAIARSVESAYEHADFVGSLVVPEGDPQRPTAWQTVPGEWFPW